MVIISQCKHTSKHKTSCRTPEICTIFLIFKKIIVFLERGEGREKERERNIDRLPLHPLQPGTWPTTQACALTGNQIGDPLLCGPAPNQTTPVRAIYNFYLLIIPQQSWKNSPLAQLLPGILTQVGNKGDRAGRRWPSGSAGHVPDCE